MKRIIALCAAVIFAISTITGCGSSAAQTAEPAEETTSETESTTANETAPAADAAPVTETPALKGVFADAADWVSAMLIRGEAESLIPEHLTLKKANKITGNVDVTLAEDATEEELVGVSQAAYVYLIAPDGSVEEATLEQAGITNVTLTLVDNEYTLHSQLADGSTCNDQGIYSFKNGCITLEEGLYKDVTLFRPEDDLKIVLLVMNSDNGGLILAMSKQA